MEKQFVTYEIALKLKELGFDEECLGYFHSKELSLYPTQFHPYHLGKNSEEILYNTDCTAPLWQQVIDWFRDKHHTNIEINRFPNISKWGFVVTDMTIIPKQQTRKENINMSLKVADVRRFDEYFECREQAILKAIELCKNN
jgi:hypothetical protein